MKQEIDNSFELAKKMLIANTENLIDEERHRLFMSKLISASE